MDLPETVGTGWVEGRWLAAALDNRDVGDRPQVGQVSNLRVLCRPTSPQIRVTFPDGPAMLWLKDVELVSDQVGNVINPVTGASGVRLIAVDNPGAEFRWLVTVTGDGMDPLYGQIALGTGETVDLADIGSWPVPVPEETAAWEAALLSFQTMRDQVVAASDAITVALGGQDLGVVAGWAADTQAARDQTLAAKSALDASIAGLNIPTLEGLRDDIAGSVSANAGHVTAAQTARAGAESAQVAAEVARDQAVQAAGGGIIDDSVTSLDFTWSSQKITAEAGKAHTHAMTEVTGLDDALVLKADAATVTDDLAAVTDTLTGKSDIGHGHIVADVNGLQAALDGKAGATHSHEMVEVNGLANALDAKAATTHTHTPAHIDGFAQGVRDAFGFRMWAGLVTITISGTAGGSEPVSFPAGTFTGNPIVTATRASSTGAEAIPYITGATMSGATIGLYNAGGSVITGTFPVMVIAVQKL